MGSSTAAASSPDRGILESSNGKAQGLNGHDEQQLSGLGEPDLREDSDRDSDDEAGDRRKPVPGGSSRGPPPLQQGAVPPPGVRQLPQGKPEHLRQQHQRNSASPAPQASPGREGSSRYFILKSINHENIQRAVADGVWATQRHNEAKLNDAFRNKANVFLIFSVNMSGHFQGYARMTSTVGGTRAQPHGWLGNAPVGTIFGIEWRRVLDLPFSVTEHLSNPLNEGKPVRIARDGQELPPPIGRELVALFEKRAQQGGVARPVPPPRPPSSAPVAAAPLGGGGQPRPPPPPQGYRPSGGGPASLPMADPNAIVFNEMGVPVGNLGSLSGMSTLGAGGSGGMGMGLSGGMMGGRMGMQVGMRPLGGMMGQMGGRGGGIMGQMGGRGGGMMGQMGGSGGGMMGQMGNSMISGGMGQMPMGSGLGMGIGQMPMGGGLGMGIGGGLGMGMQSSLGMGMAGGMGPGIGMPQGGGGSSFAGSATAGGSERHWSPKRRRSSRSRSRSPRRSRRSRSHSRDRSGKGGRSDSRPNLLQMSYDEYLEHFERVRRQRAAAAQPDAAPQGHQAAPGTMQQGGGRQQLGGGQQQMNGSSIAGGQQQWGGGIAGQQQMGGNMAGQQMMTEEAFIQHCRQLGVPYSLEQVRQHYRNVRAAMMGGQ